MPIPTVTVNAKLHYNDNTPAEGVEVAALLKSPSQNEDGYIVQKRITGLVDDQGCVALELWPNENGTVETFYEIEAVDCLLEELLSVVAVVPESAVPLDLEDIALPLSNLTLGQASGNVPSIRQINTSEGIIGGGDLTQNREFKLDFTTLTSERLDPTLTDIVAIQDPTLPDNIQYAQLANLPGLNYPVQERSYAVPGQTEILITEPFYNDRGQVQLSISGRDVYQGDWTEDADNGKIVLTGLINEGEALEGDEEILVTVLKAASLGAGGAIESSDVSYGTGTVEEALDDLYATSGATPWQPVGGDQNAVSGDRFFVDPTAAPVTITLPATPSDGAAVTVVDMSQAANISGSSLINVITIARNGELIMDIADDLIIDQANVSVQLVYANSARGWRLLE